MSQKGKSHAWLLRKIENLKWNRITYLIILYLLLQFQFLLYSHQFTDFIIFV